jgi:hypothetical protein
MPPYRVLSTTTVRGSAHFDFPLLTGTVASHYSRDHSADSPSHDTGISASPTSPRTAKATTAATAIKGR